MIQVLICIVTFSVIYLTVDKPVKYILIAKAGLKIIIKTVHQRNWIKKKSADSTAFALGQTV